MVQAGVFGASREHLRYNNKSYKPFLSEDVGAEVYLLLFRYFFLKYLYMDLNWDVVGTDYDSVTDYEYLTAR